MLISVEAYAGTPRAIQDVFPRSEKVEKEKVVLTKEEKELIEKKLEYSFVERAFVVYVGKTRERIDGYAFIISEMGKQGPIVFIVVISPEGVIERVVVHKESEREGKKIKERRFLKQFIGIELEDLFNVTKDVICTVTGATISSKAAITASKKALLIWQMKIGTATYFYKER